MTTDRRGNIEVRTDPDGTVDEVILYGADGVALVHLRDIGVGYLLRVFGTDGNPDLRVYLNGDRDMAKMKWEDKE